MADLWQTQRDARTQAAAPLAERMRPRSLDEFVGQQHILGEGMLLRRMLQADRIASVVFYGPPGTGKTTLAELIARHTKRHFERANATAVGVKDVRFVLDQAKRRLGDLGVQTIFFLDEIHRFNRAQQDILLADVERGVIVLVGATTENPFFSINSPLISRSQIFAFEPLTQDDIVTVLERAITDQERGYGGLRLEVSDEALRHWAVMSDGDARRAMTALEIAVLSTQAEQSETAGDGGEADRPIVIDLATAEASIQRKAIVYDGTGDEHYDAASALIKSMRGSDPDAAVYWVARMLEAGEDPRFIARRIAILASEDVGNADPRALSVAAAAWEITERVGMPECQLTLAQAAIYMACSPKSNATATAIWTAMADVKHQRTVPVPRHLRDKHYAGAKKLGHGEGYQYSHDSPTGFVDQDYLGVDVTYYTPSPRGYERRIAEYLEWIQHQRQPREDQGTTADRDDSTEPAAGAEGEQRAGQK